MVDQWRGRDLIVTYCAVFEEDQVNIITAAVPQRNFSMCLHLVSEFLPHPELTVTLGSVVCFGSMSVYAQLVAHWSDPLSDNRGAYCRPYA
jgi:hypothetical protein